MRTAEFGLGALLACAAALFAATLACSKSDPAPGPGAEVVSPKPDAGKAMGPGADAGTTPAPAPADAAATNPGPAPSGGDAASGSDLSLVDSDAAAGPTAAPDRFVGQWDYDTGGARLECPGEKPLTQNLFGSFLTFAVGAGASPLLLTSPDCNLRFDIKGQAAVIQPGQSCMNPIAGRAATSAPTAFSFTLQGTGAAQTSTWTVTFADAPAEPCTMSAQGMLTRKP
jgi:hypothetical protein